MAGSVSRFPIGPVVTDPELCLNRIHIRAGCSICVETCPVGAISLDDGVDLDRDSCVHCGACVWKCPVGVFAQRRLYEAELANIAEDAEGAIEIGCPLAAGGARAPLYVRLPTCLASLAPSQLIHLAETEAVFLDDSGCPDCPLDMGSVISEAAETANAWLSAWGRTGYIALSTAQAGSVAPDADTVVIELAEHVDRRGFFLALASGPEHIPERERLIQVLSQWPEPENRLVETDALGLAALEVKADLCIACGHCADFCPTEALDLSLEGSRFTLRFSPYRCVDCGICELVCQPTAFTRRTDIPVAAITAQVPLLEGGWHACKRCGQVTADHTGELCFWCGLEQNPPGVGTLLGRTPIR